MTTQSKSTRRCLTALIAITLVLGPIGDPAYAALTKLTDIPIASKVSAKPNIVYTFDDSGSMNLNYLPDYVVGAAPALLAVTKITLTGSTATVTVASTAALSAGMSVTIQGANQPQYNGVFPIDAILSGTTFTYTVVGTPVSPATGTIKYYVGSSYCRSGSGTTACNGVASPWNYPPFLDADFNHLAYDPNVTYTAPKKYDGSSYSDETAAFTTNYTKVQPDPFLAPATFNQNLAAKVSVPVYCNTDWPKLNNDTPTSSSLQLSDIGNPNGEYSSGSGAWCRINGTKYDASATSGAPAAIDDYNYPWQNTVAPNDAKYFYRNIGSKTIWCDTTSPYRPRTGVITGCNGGTPITGAPVQQTCNQNAKTCNPVVASRNYTPAACKTPSYQYCAPGIGGSDSFSPGTGTVASECSACTCNRDYQPPGGKCSITSAACTGPYGVPGGDTGECPDQPGPITGCTGGTPIYQLAGFSCGALMWDPSTNAAKVPNTTLLADSQGLGQVCRHNNQTYATGGAAGLFKYGGTYLGDVSAADQALGMKGQFTTSVATGACGLNVGTTIAIPRHYYTVDSVQFCSNAILVTNDQWKGFGTGACQTKNDFTTHSFPKYGQFHRIDLVNDGRLFLYTDPFTGVPGTRTWDQEMTNYANWYAYYRTRVLAAKTTSALAFSYLDQTWRVGFHTLSTPATNWVDVDDWMPGPGLQRDKWYSKLLGVTIPPAQTPTLDALLRVGELFRTGKGGAGSLPAMPEGYIPATARDPITVSCQNNYNILFTDGFTNQPTTPTPAWIGEVDGGSVPCAGCFPPDPGASQPEVTVAGLRALAGTPWPDPFKDPVPTANTLADIALYYWMTDLRPSASWTPDIAKDNVPSDDGRAGADLKWTKDPAFWQHINLSAISFGSEGVLDASNASTVTDSIAAGTSQWFTSPNAPAPPNNPVWPKGDLGATAVDDLWHATANARGKFVYAKNPLQVAAGLASIIAGIANNRKSRSGAAFAGQALSLAANDRIFEATIEKGWAGDLIKVQIDPTTGQEISSPPNPEWSAGAKLNSLLATPAPGTSPALDSDNAWFKDRRIVAWKPGTGAVPFLYADLSAAQLATLSGDPVTQQKMIAYLRGGSTFGPGTLANGFTAPSIEGTAIGQFRERFGKLGDISDSQPLVVDDSAAPFIDATDPGYTAFAAAKKGRAPRIYVGANDGMVHVFDAGPLFGPFDSSAGGDEMFAYIPSALFNDLKDENGAPKGIQALTYQDGGIPIYKHHFYVDATPRAADVDFANTGGAGGSGDWRTIVVGGLGKGGNTYYAIDATVPTAKTDTEAAVAGKILWEFTDPDIQFTFGRPIIAKTRADGWVVVVTAGYNNFSGKGKLYFLNAKTGELIRTMTTTGDDPGTPANPSGLTQINGFTQDFHNQIIEQIYGGDLNGNVWRFDVSDPDPAKWSTVLFAQVTDPSGDPQPVTTAPQIEIDLNNGVDRWVFFGTGRLLHIDDLTVPDPEQIETFYAIRDGTITAPDTTAGFLPVIPRATLAAGNALTTAPIAGGAPKGWYIDLPLGQRIVVDPSADLNVATFIATAGPNDQCAIGLPANLYARDYTTAESDVEVGGSLQASFYSAEGAVSGELVGLEDPASAFPKLSVIFSKETTGATASFNLKLPSITGGHRMSWRVLGP
ncbi:MAG TPA: PilC/PilY family type IV pilus protein [Casimicrobiaceae bacterium]